MSDKLVTLQRMLARTNAQAFDGLTFDLEPLANQIAELTKWVNGSASPNPESDIVLDAVERFATSGSLGTLRDLQLVAFGCMVPFGSSNRRLIGEAELFSSLLQLVQNTRLRPRAFRRCYRGLLAGYLNCNPDDQLRSSVAQSNWSRLREFLGATIDYIRSPDSEPNWAIALAEHSNLLTENPTARYAKLLLEESNSEFKRVREALDISDASWLIVTLLRGQIAHTTSQSDQQFVDDLPRLLTLLSENQQVLNFGLSKVLERYAQCRDKTANKALCDFAVAQWGIPWLSSNSARWGRVAEATKQMLVDWLKLEFIQQFFGLLAEDGANDKRRLQFWELYHKNIDDMYFALGRHARSNPSRDFVELRRKMGGRILELTAGGSPRNNAFIMHIGKYVVVEFGVSGNACYIFEKRNPPFHIERGTVAGDRSELKHEDHVQRLLHVDSNSGQWERVFSETLRRLANVTLQSPASSSKPLAIGDHISRSKLPTVYSRSELERFCQTNGLKVRDLTAMKGNLWVETGQPDPMVSRQLLVWGFRYKEGKGWWREKA